ncbi:hypothetical protein CCHL11_04351 [Colletotrichum chlorophyti]|uniref:Protein kinase domain-containing protein n=1 Tax=Colletotrichum chlorophyti TaxID=708187 RepID=A0A1Q8RLS7_9PEZI|nr:hypothetical protein CCHL11_04351 [Colletotrichum chlorophyti]
MEDPDHPQRSFQLVKRIQDNIWTARRLAQHSGYVDGEEFIARKLDDFDEYFAAGKYSMGLTTKSQRRIKGLMDLLYECSLGRNISYIFNHENIVSLAGHIRQQPFHGQVDATEDYLVWDLCDAGTLEILFADRSVDRDPNCFLPESLCWHVLTSTMRALVWLHDGYRQQDDWVTGEWEWARTDTEWMPILHRGINAQSIFFQHPRGKETYGVCKLGKFGKATVSGIPARRHGPAGYGEKPIPHSTMFPAALRQGVTSIGEMRTQWMKYLSTTDRSNRLYTLSDDHWALGAVLFRMMTNIPLPSTEGCKACHCIHIRRCKTAECSATEDHGANNYECAHENFWGCRCQPNKCNVEADVHLDEVLRDSGYSWQLKRAVRILLDYDLMLPAVETRCYADEIEKLYRSWRMETVDGRAHVDVKDDLRARFLVLNHVDLEELDDYMEETVE